MAVTMNPMKENVILIDKFENQYAVYLSPAKILKARTDTQYYESILAVAKNNFEIQSMNEDEYEADNAGNPEDNEIILQTGTNNAHIQNIDVMQENKNDSNDSSVIESNINSNNFNKNDHYIWSESETLLLISIYKEHKDIHKGSMKSLWNNISVKMMEKGCKISSEKCCSKIQALKRQYKNVIDHNKTSGESRKKWKYFEVLQEIFHKQPWVEPLSVAGSSVVDNNTTKEKTIKRRKTNLVESLLEEKKIKRKNTERMHYEKMKRFDSIENLLSKLIERERT